MESHFDQIPQELTLQIFLQLEDFDDLFNYIRAFKLEEILSNGNIWKFLYNQKFENINIQLITIIDFKRKNYAYYVSIYYNLMNSYHTALSSFNIVRNLLERIMKNYIEQPFGNKLAELLAGMGASNILQALKILKTLDVREMPEVPEELRKGLYTHSYIINPIGVYTLFTSDYSNENDHTLLKIVSGRLDYKIIRLEIYYNKCIIVLIGNNSERIFEKEISNNQAIECLMYVEYNGIKK